jgi:hypothetical protein
MTIQIKIGLSPTYSRGGVGDTMRACADIIERAYQKSVREQAKTARLLAETQAMTRKAAPRLTKAHKRPDRSQPTTNRTPAVIERRMAIHKLLRERGPTTMVELRATLNMGKSWLACDINWLVEMKLVEEERFKVGNRTFVRVRAINQ